MMFKLIFVFSIVALLNGPKNDAIAWKENQKLTWQQFKGLPKMDQSAVAVTASGISFGFSTTEKSNDIVSFTTEVKADFYPSKSWVKLDRATDYILVHEQGHFDITELYARKFRKLIAEVKISNHLKKELHELNERINSELYTMQRLYDAETDSSRNKKSQSKWNQLIKEELNKLTAFKFKE